MGTKTKLVAALLVLINVLVFVNLRVPLSRGELYSWTSDLPRVLRGQQREDLEMFFCLYFVDHILCIFEGLHSFLLPLLFHLATFSLRRCATSLLY